MVFRYGRTFGVVLAAFLLAAAPALAYVVKLKDGTVIFARTAYTVKDKKAIITLENGTVTQYDLDKIDVPGTEEYNKKYPDLIILHRRAVRVTQDRATVTGCTHLGPVASFRKDAGEAMTTRNSRPGASSGATCC